MRMDVALKDENINSTRAAMVISADPELHMVVLPETAECKTGAQKRRQSGNLAE